MKLLLYLTSLLASCSAQSLYSELAPRYNKTEINRIAKSVITRLTSMKDWSTGWDWGQGVGLYGIWQHYKATDDSASFKAVQDWYNTRLPAGQNKHVNSMAIFSVLADLYNTTGSPSYVPYMNEWAEWAMYNLTRTEKGGMQHVTSGGPNTQQLWVDTLMMAAVPLAKIGKVLGRPQYIEEARKQFNIHIKYLWDADADLFYHGWTFIDRDNFAGAHWARGNAWASITMVEFLELMGASLTDPGYQPLFKTLIAQLASLEPLQDEISGLWSTVLDVPVSNGSYLETSSSAGYTFSYFKANRKGWIKEAYQPVTAKSIEGLINNVATSGEVLNVSAGTGIGETVEYYFNVRKVQTMWGQAMVVMALSELLRTL